MGIVDEWADDAASAPEPSSPAPGPASKSGRARKGKKKADVPPLVFRNIEEFVRDYVAPTYRRKLSPSTATWCPDWWRHEEALQRLGAMWRTWENLRHDPVAGLRTWFLHHGDPHMRVLMDPDTGPFAYCTPKGHAERPLQPLPLNPANPVLWLSPAFSADAGPSG